MINIAELLKDAPKGMKLYSPLLGEVNFVRIDKQSDYPIDVTDCNGNGRAFTEFGVYFAGHPDAECLLFPSKEVRTWEGLKLPVEPKFKVGDWLYHNSLGVRPILVKDCNEAQGYKVECSRTSYYLQKDVVENEYHLWTIQDAKDGDVLVSGIDNPFIYDGNIEFSSAGAYVGVSRNGRIRLDMFPSKAWTSIKDIKPATKEQCDLLFSKMKEAGYTWDEKKKELHKIQHYDISNFYAGMPVLVRDGDSDDDDWTYALFSHYNSTRTAYKFSASGDVFRQCIPFNEKTEHLLGTTDIPSEEYINW